jgi:NAD(P)-dependent dehydrogenase (short-subunit alcohol dehydrogenase family)
MSVPVWFITGSTSGFGKNIALEALSRGHKVIATARNASKLSDLQASGADVLSLDVTAPLEELRSKAAEAHAIHGRITHLINSAGYILEGAIEETT